MSERSNLQPIHRPHGSVIGSRLFSDCLKTIRFLPFGVFSVLRQAAMGWKHVIYARRGAYCCRFCGLEPSAASHWSRAEVLFVGSGSFFEIFPVGFLAHGRTFHVGSVCLDSDAWYYSQGGASISRRIWLALPMDLRTLKIRCLIALSDFRKFFLEVSSDTSSASHEGTGS